ncbi:MAG: septum formation initiator family protein [Chitinophagaceae bacterium]
MKHIIDFFTSKFLIAVAAFAVWLFFFDKNDVPSQVSRQQELNMLNAKIEYYKGQIKSTATELNNLQSNQPAALEKYAREKYFMKRDNEEVFIIE